VFWGVLDVLVIGILAWVLWPVHPRDDRNWLPEFNVTPEALLDSSRVVIRGVRNFRWNPDGSVLKAWDDRAYDLGQLQRVWFVLSPFGEKWRGPAHAFLSFQFGDTSFVSVSVEARKEVGESYSVWKGLLRRYELMYVIADERDMLPRRVQVYKDDVFLYPATVGPERARRLFLDMLQRSNNLRKRPEYYNTVTNNCTNNVLRHVNRIGTERIRGGWRVVLPGYSDALAMRHHLLDTDLPLEDARKHFRVNDGVKRCNLDEDFSTCIRRTD
jgi:hypothetical protein